MKKIIFALCLLLLFALLISCGDGKPAEHPSDTEPTATEAPSPAPDGIEGKLISGEDRPRIVYAAGAKKAALKIQDKLSSLDPLSITEIGYYQLVSDESSQEGDKPEIVVGIANRGTSTEAQMTLPSYLDYAIVSFGRDIAIVANTPERLEDAVDKFLSLLETHKTGDTTHIFYTGDSTVIDEYTDYPYDSLSLGGTSIEEFRVIISKDATEEDRRIAEEIVSWLQLSVGATLEIKVDAEANDHTKHEILIGKTDREASAAADALTDDSHYCLKMADGDLVLAAAGRKGYVRGFSALKKEINENQNNLQEGTDIMNTESTRSLDGKNILFAGNSFVYYGHCILEGNQKELDYGYLYEICKANGDNVKIYDYVWGGKDLKWIYDNHLSQADPEFLASIDIVFLSEAGNNNAGLVDDVEEIRALFPADTEFYYMSHSYVYQANSTAIIDSLPRLIQRGIPVGDWGAIAYDLWTGRVKFSDSKLSYNKETFIKNNGDTFHQNMLSGYITAQMAYCLATGVSAVGQDYSFCTDTSVNSRFDIDSFIEKHYTPGSTNMDKVFASPYDMTEIQKLIDEYIEKVNYS